MSIVFPKFFKDSHECEACQLSKATRLPFVSSKSRTNSLFEIVHSDVLGPSNVESFDGYKYYVTFVDDYSRTTWLYLLKFNSEVFDAFKDFHNLVKTQFSSKIHILRSDNGTKYTSNIMSTIL